MTLNRESGNTSRSRRRAWHAVLTSLFVLIGLFGGLALYLSTPSAYTAETRIAVGHATLSAIQVPGYVSATQQLASDYARYVQNTLAERKQLPDGGLGVVSISASPIPESNVIRVEVQATKPAVAVQDVAAITKSLLNKVSSTNPDLEKTQQAFAQAYVDFQKAEAAATAANNEVAALRANPSANRAAIEAARATAIQSATDAARLDLEQQALGANYRAAYSDAMATPSLTIIKSASGAVSDSGSRLQRNLLMGVLGGALLASGYLYLLRRRSGRVARGAETEREGGPGEHEVALSEAFALSANGRR